jgi:hypothetical protein
MGKHYLRPPVPARWFRGWWLSSSGTRKHFMLTDDASHHLWLLLLLFLVSIFCFKLSSNNFLHEKAVEASKQN